LLTIPKRQKVEMMNLQIQMETKKILKTQKQSLTLKKQKRQRKALKETNNDFSRSNRFKDSSLYYRQ